MASICRKDFSSTSAVFIRRDDALINPDAIRTMTHPRGGSTTTHTPIQKTHKQTHTAFSLDFNSERVLYTCTSEFVQYMQKIKTPREKLKCLDVDLTYRS